MQFFEHLLNENRVNLSIAMSGSNLITATKCAYKLNIAKITTNYLNALTIGIWVLYSNLHKANESNSISDSLIVILWGIFYLYYSLHSCRCFKHKLPLVIHLYHWMLAYLKISCDPFRSKQANLNNNSLFTLIKGHLFTHFIVDTCN